jgi:hypothetical protein
VSLELVSELPTCLAHAVGTVPESLLPFSADGNTEEEVLNLLLTKLPLKLQQRAQMWPAALNA